MLKSLFNILLIFTGIVFLVVFALILSLKIAFPEQKLKKLSADGIRGFVSREAHFGSIHWGLGGIEIKEFALSQTPNFDHGPLLTIKKISFQPGYIPGKSAAMLTVENPKLILERFPEGFGRLEVVDPAIKQRSHRRNFHFPPFKVMNVINGEIVYLSDKTGKNEIAVEKININLKSDTGRRFIIGNINAVILTGNKDMDLAADLHIDVTADTIGINKAVIRIDKDNAIEITGNIEGFFSKGGAQYAFDLGGDRVVLDAILEAIPKCPELIQYGKKPKISLHVSGGLDNLKVTENKNGR